MDNISDITFTNYSESRFVQPLRMHYSQDGVKKNWDLVKVHQSVSIIIFNITRKVFVFVRQFRPPVYYSAIPEADRKDHVDVKQYPGKLGVTLELCAGVVDKSKSLKEIAQDEVLEECGYQVPLINLHEVITYKSSVGIAGDLQTLFYAEVTDDMKVSSGGGLASEGEFIEVVEMSVDEAQMFLKQNEVPSPGGLLFALLWFIHNKLPHYQNK